MTTEPNNSKPHQPDVAARAHQDQVGVASLGFVEDQLGHVVVFAHRDFGDGSRRIHLGANCIEGRDLCLHVLLHPLRAIVVILVQRGLRNVGIDLD